MLKGKFIKQVSVLFSGLLLVQIINFIFSLLLPKYVTPPDFALFGIFTAVVFILAEIVNAKLDVAVMLGTDDKEAEHLVTAAHTFAAGFVLFLIFISLLLVFYFDKIYALLPFAVAAYGIHQPVLVRFNQQEQYKKINTFRFIQVSTTAIMTLVLAILKIKYALIIGFCAGLSIATIYTMFFMPVKLSVHILIFCLKKYKQFPAYGTWSSLLNNLSKNSIPILLKRFFSANEVGYYAYATRLLNAPTGMYSSAISQVYFKNAVSLNPDDLKQHTYQLIRMSVLLGIIPSILILFFGKSIFLFLFNPEWVNAGIVAQYLILWYFIGIITGPISVLLDIKYKLKAELFYNLLLLLMRVMAILLGAYLHNFLLAILTLSLVGFVMNFILLNYLLYLVNHD